MNKRKQVARVDAAPSLTATVAAPLDLASRVFRPWPVVRALQRADDYRALLQQEAVIAQVLAEVADRVARQRITALSFDVFDTALMRRPESEARRFFDAGARFAKQCKQAFSATDALLARAMAAKAAYRFANAAIDGTREGRLALIANIACNQLQLAGKESAYQQNELAYEQDNLTPNPLVQAIIAHFPQLPTLFLSDMYLESAQIEPLLARHFKGAFTVYSSADGHGSKRSGGLYLHMLTEQQWRADQVLHFGDNLHSDFQMAKTCGLAGYYLPLADAERLARRQCYDSLAAELAEQGLLLADILPFNC